MLTALLVLAAVGAGFYGLSRWLPQRRWREARGHPLSSADRQLLSEIFPPYETLSGEERARLELLMQYFLRFKNITVLEGPALSREEELLLASHACLLLLHQRAREPFATVTNVFIMPASYVERDNPVDPETGVPFHFERLGELRERGPMIISREELQALTSEDHNFVNIVVHEFAHELDQSDGAFDGTPELGSAEAYRRWAQVMGREFERLRAQQATGEQTRIDPYAATDEAEFFAVVAEHFFTAPRDLEEGHPELFALYREFFGLDPRRWCVD